MELRLKKKISTEATGKQQRKKRAKDRKKATSMETIFKNNWFMINF
jgi:hypothetical protein